MNSWPAFTDAWRDRECEPTFTLEAHIASLRDTDPKLWAQLNADWNNPNFKGDRQDV